MRPVILALDLGLTTGLCWGAPGERPQFGCLRLPGPERGNGARFGALSNAVSDLITEHRPALVVKEAPMRLGGMTSTNTARLHYGYHGAVEEGCWRRDVPCREEEADTVRKAMIGRSRWPRGTEVKAEIIKWVIARGIDCHQGDQADAVVLWLWACGVFGARTGAGRPAMARAAG